MNEKTRTRRAAAWTWAAAMAALLAFAPLVSAQQLTGNVYGYVADEQGGHCTYCDFGWICRKNHGRVRRKPEWTPAVTRYWEIVRP